jgi:hypothetical protein
MVKETRKIWGVRRLLTCADSTARSGARSCSVLCVCDSGGADDDYITNYRPELRRPFGGAGGDTYYAPL